MEPLSLKHSGIEFYYRPKVGDQGGSGGKKSPIQFHKLSSTNDLEWTSRPSMKVMNYLLKNCVFPKFRKL